MAVDDSRLLDLCDGKLLTEDGYTFDIHRYLLARKSEYFRSMFCGINKGKKEFRIHGISGKCLGEILTYFYTGSLSVDEQIIADVMEFPDYCLLKDLSLKIEKSFQKNITVSNCLQLYDVARRLNEDISGKCFRFIETKFGEITRTQMNVLADLPLEILEKILGSRSLNVYSETAVWQSIVEWTLKDIPNRLHYVPQLLMCLAAGELGEDLAAEILQHEIVSKNPFMKELNDLKDSPDCTSSLDALLGFQANGLGCFRYRIPSHLHFICSYDKLVANNEDNEVFRYPPLGNLYITYDENFDLFRKVAQVEDGFLLFLIVVGHNVYAFDDGHICKKFDLVALQWIPMAHFRHAYRKSCVVELDGYIYIMGDLAIHLDTMQMEVYDTANDRWSDCPPACDTYYGTCQTAPVVIDKKIYFVGTTGYYEEMTMRVFDTVSRTWTPLPPPKAIRHFFAHVAYHGKAYAIGGNDSSKTIEIFDPVANLWEEFAFQDDPPYEYIGGTVLNDQIHLYERMNSGFRPSVLHWNDAEGRYERLLSTRPYSNNVKLYSFSKPVLDVGALRSLTEGNRRPKTHLVAESKYVYNV